MLTHLSDAAIVGDTGKHVVAGGIYVHADGTVLVAQHSTNGGGAEDKSHVVLSTLLARVEAARNNTS